MLFNIRDQHEVLKLKFKVIRGSKTALGAERTTFMTHLAYINNCHLAYRVLLLSSSIHKIAFVKYIVVTNESRLTPAITLDQPLYVIEKSIQCDPTTRFNEDNYKYFVFPSRLRKSCCVKIW